MVICVQQREFFSITHVFTASSAVNNISTQRPIIPPLSKPLWPVDDVVQSLNTRIGLAAIHSHISPPNSSPVPRTPTQHEIQGQFKQPVLISDQDPRPFNGYTGADLAEALVHPGVKNQQTISDLVGATGRLTSSKQRLVELQQAQTHVHGQSQYSFQPYRSESGLDQALVEVPSSTSAASPRRVATASHQPQDSLFQPYQSKVGLDMALAGIPPPAPTVPSQPALALTLPATSTNCAPSSSLVAAPARKRKAGSDEASGNMSASAPSSSAPTKKRKLTPSSTKARQPPVPRYFPSTSSYRRIESRPSALTSQHSENYQRLPREPNATAYDMLGIPTSTGRPGSRYGPFAPRNREDLMRRS
ncbi:hypothetical protein CVT26_000896 [Gymnopilus dilepis]|uniref:Uncharacterized protein n=1 Tax=Gymnopilus dilepis TaxID=231916 RepID=A0A409WW40_9AGAR|nr:hypothetical protein CVT26_000896 [Gymnopilus dilepis]